MKKCLMIDDYMVEKVLDKIKEKIGIWKFEDTKILINTDDKLSDETTLKRVVILMTCVIKDGCKFYPQFFLIMHYMMNKHNTKHLKKISAKN